ncbi:MAG: glycosyltransferase [Helicobacter sp.]|nr:glycosyltransferase [Helicobacter sp.]
MMRILITGGGTGGHLSVAEAVAEQLHALGHCLYYLGAKAGQEAHWFDDKPLFAQKLLLDVQGIANKTARTLPRAALAQASAAREALAFLRAHGIERVFSVGGYAAAPACFAALWAHIPLYIHEQNAAVGLLNGILRRFCREFYSSYLPDSPVRDYPLRTRCFEGARVRESVRTVLFLGGSLGARTINDLALRLAPLLLERGIAVIHQCGKRDLERVSAKYAAMGVQVELFDFSPNLIEAMRRADFAIARAGASSLWELCANGLPGLFVPYPYAAKNHQFYNAEFLVKQNLATMMCEDALEDSAIMELVCDSALICERSARLAQSIAPNGAHAIALRVAGA